MAGLGDLRGLLQPQRFCDSVILYRVAEVSLTPWLTVRGVAALPCPLPHFDIHTGGCMSAELIKNIYLHILDCLVNCMLQGRVCLDTQPCVGMSIPK